MKSQMLTKRMYFIISCIMILVLFMFQFSSLVRQKYNRYDENIYADNTSALTAKNRFTVQTDTNNVLSDTHHFVVYIGNLSDNAAGATVYQWCEYTKRNLLNYQSVQDYRSYWEKRPDAVLLDAAFINIEQDISLLTTLTDYGVHLVWCTLPDFDSLTSNSRFMELLGIANAVTPSLAASGLKLYSGFLLGGETWYIADNEEEKTYQDFSLDLPWYITGNGTKTYMAAVLDSTQYGTIKTEDLPAVFWRKSLDNAYIFCVNGDYLSTAAGLGILNAILYELQDYALYPVINAQMVSVLNYPVLAFEQEAAMDTYYSRNTSSVLENLVWPDIANLSEYTNSRFTFLFTPQFDYADENAPSTAELEYFFRLFHEKKFEAGLSATRDSLTGLEMKFKKDAETFETFLPHYRFLSIYAKENETTAVLSSSSKLLSSLKTIVTDKNTTKNEPLFSYCDNNTLKLQLALNGNSYSYQNDFLQKCLNTALAYSSIGIDLSDISNPSENSLLWDKTYQKTATALSSYLPKLTADGHIAASRAFTKCTVSETDRRIRQFLAMDYDFIRTKDTITLHISNLTSDSSLLLRLHNETIAQANGGSFTQLEDGAYLLSPDNETMQITLKK